MGCEVGLWMNCKKKIEREQRSDRDTVMAFVWRDWGKTPKFSTSSVPDEG
jgi:hypothetical protein